MEINKAGKAKLLPMNLEDENGDVYECSIPEEQYNRIIEGDYDIANKYLQQAIENKNRLLAVKLLLTEAKKRDPPGKTTLETSCVASTSSNSNIDQSYIHEDNHEDIQDDNSNEYTIPDLESPLFTKHWSYESVLALIASMSTHIEDLNHPKKKKHVFEHISNDLLSKGFNYSDKMCFNKWRSLLRSYRNTKDKKSKTGMGVTRFLFFDQMDEILGDKPSNASGHTIESSEERTEPTSSDSNLVDQIEEDSTSTNCGVVSKESKKRKRKTSSDIHEMARQKRHEEKLEIERKKLEIEEKKVKLIEKLIDKL